MLVPRTNWMKIAQTDPRTDVGPFSGLALGYLKFFPFSIS